ncbi:MAG: aminopeptidase [Planctomycetes bacterium]|nr:aminopeptidase [Planctomycetota bacterium]
MIWSRTKFFPILLGLALWGCQSGYVLRQGIGELGILWGAKRVENEAGGEAGQLQLGEAQRRNLELIPEIRRFAREEIGLEVGDAYTAYYETGGKAISYIVSAAHPLAMIPYRWSFPFVGEVAYKGFFDRADAEAERDRLAQAGWDTRLSEVGAFSTLGWFEDPILSTMLDLPPGELAELLIHELIHRTVFFKDRIALNESLAAAVARAGARRFIEKRFGSPSPELAGYFAGLEEADFHNRLLHRLRQDLDALYRSALPDPVKRRRKAAIFATASAAMFPEPAAPGKARPALPPSNALILASGQYQEHVPMMEKLLDHFDGDLPRLVAFLKSLPKDEDPVPAMQQMVSPQWRFGSGGKR